MIRVMPDSRRSRVVLCLNMIMVDKGSGLTERLRKKLGREMLNVESVPSFVAAADESTTMDVEEEKEERDPKRMRLEQQPFPDFKMPDYREIDFELQIELKKLLPSMAEAYKNEDWVVLHRYSSTGSSLNIEDTLKPEFAAISSVWLLFSEVPPHIKEGAARVLTCISFGTSEAPNVSNQEYVKILVLRVLCGDGGTTVEVQRQVCLAICFLASCSGRCLPVVSFGAGIQDRLLELIRDPCFSSELTFPLISAIANIALVNNVMREKILETQLSDSWLGKLMYTKHDDSILKEACLAVACIASVARGKGCEVLWNRFKYQFMPAIVNKCCNFFCNDDVLKAAALAIVMITKYAASSPDKIKDVVRRGCLKALFHLNYLYNAVVLSCCVVGIKIILRAGDVDDQGRRRRPKYNEYAKLIDDFDPGWDILIDDNVYYCGHRTRIRAENILLKYRHRMLQRRWSYESDSEDWDEDEDEDEDKYVDVDVDVYLDDDDDDDDDGDDDDEMSEDEADLQT